MAPHNPNGPVATAVCLQQDVNRLNFLIQEMNISIPDWVWGLIDNVIPIKEGHIEVPSTHDPGIEFDRGKLRKRLYRPGEANLGATSSTKLKLRRDWLLACPTG